MLIFLDISSVLLLFHCCLFSLHICFISSPDMHSISISPLLFFHSLALCSFIIFLCSLPFCNFLTIFNSLQFWCTLSLSLCVCFHNLLHMDITCFIQITSWLFSFSMGTWIFSFHPFDSIHFSSCYYIINNHYNTHGVFLMLTETCLCITNNIK